jgi:hypothetical protein
VDTHTEGAVGLYCGTLIFSFEEERRLKREDDREQWRNEKKEDICIEKYREIRRQRLTL